MAELTPEIDPSEVGLDANRLLRIDAHFARYVDEAKLAGWLAVVTRRGKIVHVGRGGARDAEADLPVTTDTLWRVYSMTKPITSVAAMMLVEQGMLELNDPVSRYIPEFADTRVYLRGSALRPLTVPQTEPIRLWHLLTHTSGLTYGFHQTDVVDAIYRQRGYELGTPPGRDLAGACADWASMPLAFQPGTEWNYGVSTDVLGRVIEVVSGLTLDRFFAERIFEPLGLTDTGFSVPAEDQQRLAALYTRHPGTGRFTRNDALGSAAKRVPTVLAGGHGLVSSAADYHRFTQMLLGGGELEGTRLLGSRTVDYMVRNHLPGDADLHDFGRPLFAETPMVGTGFGLGFAVNLDAAAGKVLTSEGEFGWGGMASTVFWVDPAEEITALLFTQLMPSDTYPLRSQFRTLTYQAVVD